MRSGGGWWWFDDEGVGWLVVSGWSRGKVGRGRALASFAGFVLGLRMRV